MISESQDTRYFDRMSASIGDKVRILEFLVPGKVLDVGAGGGELSYALSTNKDYQVIAIDGSPAAIERMNHNYPNIEAHCSMVSNLLEIFEEETFDNIVCSSILHEVYSYEPGSQVDKMRAIEEAFEIFMKLLKPGGKLVIRDGVKPTNWRKTVMWRLDGDYTEDFVKAFEHSPFLTQSKDMSENSVENSIQINRAPDTNVFFSDLGSAMEFLYTYTWGMGSSDREIQEFYGIMTEDEYVGKLTNAGFMVEYHEQYLQDGYKKFLEAWLSTELPSSNMIISAKKEG